MTNGEKFKGVFGFGADGSRVIAVNATWWDCEFQNRKPITNADRIKSMTDEELAEFLTNVSNNERAMAQSASGGIRIPWKAWLKMEAENG